MGNFNSLVSNGYKVLEGQKMSHYTSLEIGGPASGLIVVDNEKKLVELLKEVEKEKLKYMVIASGSDLLVSDKGYDGLVIVNKVTGISLIETTGVEIKAGTVLQELVDFANENGFAGIENMAGIPGSVGGAIYGNAGAYGQTISDTLTSVNVYKNGDVTRMGKEECKFDYRESVFKRNKGWIILSATFEFSIGPSLELKQKSLETIELRSKKYHPGLKSPGSFFKNVVARDLPNDILKSIPPEKQLYGKVPAGYLLEQVGAKGDKLNGIEIASYHGNLFINKENGKAQDFFELAKKYKRKVYEKFRINLEPEVQLVGFEEKI